MSELISKISQLSEIPEEIISNISKIEFTGNKKAVIENHKSIILYSSKCIIIKLKKGLIAFEGDNLNIEYINKSIIELWGCIHSVKFENME